MPEVVLKLKTDQVVDMVKNLEEKEKLRILKMLEETLWGKRFEDLIKNLHQKAKSRLSFEEITKEVEEIRKKRYESSH